MQLHRNIFHRLIAFLTTFLSNAHEGWLRRVFTEQAFSDGKCLLKLAQTVADKLAQLHKEARAAERAGGRET